MSRVNLVVVSWNRFIARDLVIEPQILGAMHEFQFDQHRVRVTLPPNEKFPEGGRHGKRISIGSWRENEGQIIPLEYWIHDVDVSVLLPAHVTVPEEVLAKPINAFDLFSQNEQERLNQLADIHGEIATKAFDTWIRTLRWKCNNSSIGRPQIQGSESGWATYLLDDNTKKKIWASQQTISVSLRKVVTTDEWEAVGSALNKGLLTPVYYDFLFDGIEHLKIGDLHRAVVDFAVACESYIRTLVTETLPADLRNSFRKYIDEANIRQVITRFLADILTEDERRVVKRIESSLHQLFDARNKILHSGHIDNLDPAMCEKYLEITRSIISIRSDTGHIRKE